MRIQSSHSHDDRGVDAYFSPPEAVVALINIERDHIPNVIWEPACGDGAIVKPLKSAGYKVYASDLMDYGLVGSLTGIDYLKVDAPTRAEGIITNPPYKLAQQFAQKAIDEVPYVAFLLRTNFLEGTKRMSFFKAYPPSRIWISSRRLPMMHRFGWTGNKAPSNTCHCWFVWDGSSDRGKLDWFDWKDYS